jgi:ubiquinone/menaquinone biosynthesis C-methylase UbiE
MTSVFAESINLLLPYLTPALVQPPQISALKAMTAQMAPILRGGFECRLGDNAPQVDVQQCVISDADEPSVLRDHVKAFSAPTDIGWAPLQSLLNQWADPDSPLQEVPELWLEYDCPEVTDNLPLPSIFLALPSALSAKSNTYQMATQILDTLLGCSLWSGWQQSLYRCFAACPDGVFVSHIGVMLSRSIQALRINVKRLQPDFLIPYLQQLGWSGDTAAVEMLMTQLAAQVDRITVCLDVGIEINPQIGFECIFQQQPQQEPRWSMFLDYLLNQGYCTPTKGEALLNWPGTTTPNHSPWPERLIGASLLQPSNRFTSFDRRLSHIKLVYHPQHPVKAKGYLWFAHQWLQPKSLQPKSFPASKTEDSLTILPYEQWNSPHLTHAEKIIAYFDATTQLYLDHLGTTFQGWMVKSMGNVAASNVYLASRAELQPGDHILDAGCGVCGPAIDIAQAWDTVMIDGITISPPQGRIATQLIQKAGLTERVRVYVGDYHQLPWPSHHFDGVLFLESSNHSDDPQQLFAEVYRVLRPGGYLYIKDVFKRPADQVSVAEQRSLREFDTLFVDQTRTLAQTVEILTDIGFQSIQIQDMADIVSGDRWQQATIEIKGGRPQLTPFGEAHQARFEVWPVLCGEIKARKPT